MPTSAPADVIDLATLTRLHRAHVDTLVKRYADVLAHHALDGVLLHAGTPLRKSAFDDQYWPLSVVPHFRHWLPLAVAGSAVLVVPGRKPTLFHHVARDFWEGPQQPETDHFWDAFDVVQVKHNDHIRDALRACGSRIAFVGEDRAAADELGLSGPRFAPPALLKALDALRVQKSAYEVLCLREANRRAARGHAAVLRAFADGDHSELELHLLYLRETAQDDPETPYKNIVALDDHAATLHHVSYGRKARAAQSLLLDAGATYQGYDSDITRTAVKGTGAAADSFRALVVGVEHLQQQLCRDVRAGMNYEELHDRSHEMLARVLVDIGMSRGLGADGLVDRGVTRKLFPHGLGHSLGIQTHDVGCRNTQPAEKNPFLRHTSEISAGQVFTIEPGCYFITSLLDDLRGSPVAHELDWKLIDALTPFGGVRIEDDLHVTADGHDNLTRPFLPG